MDVRRLSVKANPEIYEPIYDSRWRLLNQVIYFLISFSGQSDDCVI
jgi:hypothetical protein